MESNLFTSTLAKTKKILETRGRALLLALHLRSIVTLALDSWNRLMRSAFAMSFVCGN